MSFKMKAKIAAHRKSKRSSKKMIVPKWKLFRSNEPILSVFMWGINHTIAELSHVPPPTLLLPDDFKAFSKVKVKHHLFNKDNMPSQFKIKEYCPNVFRNLREQFGVDDEKEYLKSLTKREPEITDSPGKTSANFYVTYDAALNVKTLCKEEVAEVLSILPDYHEYVVKKHGQTLLPQFLGLYRLTVENTETYMFVSRNIYGRRFPIHVKYDLKGCTVDRKANNEERAKDLPTLKDNDFTEEGRKLYFPDDAKLKLMDILIADTEFLTKLHLMDYSLLVCIHDCSKDNQPKKNSLPDGVGELTDSDDGSANSNEIHTKDFSNPDPHTNNPSNTDPSVRRPSGLFIPMSDCVEYDEFYAIRSRPDAPRKEIYYIGLVDIFTYYGIKKEFETAVKSVKYGADSEISTIKPIDYTKRFLDFVLKTIADS